MTAQKPNDYREAQSSSGTESKKIAVLSQDEVISTLNRWGSGGFFRSNRLGDQIHICDCVGHPCQVVTLKTHYERRNEKTVTEPYQGGAVDSSGQRPGMWDIKVAAPAAFREGRYEQVIPHTDRVTTCGNCNGICTVRCGPCFGSGKITCSMCAGTGFRNENRVSYRTEWRNGRSEQVSYSETVQVMCCFCSGGRKQCLACSGRGDVRCSNCAGYGQLKSYQLLTVTFSVEERKSVAEAPSVLTTEVVKVSGTPTYQREEEEISSATDLGEKLRVHAAILLKQASGAGGRVLRQRLVVEAIPVTQVVYKRRMTGEEKSLWIYGREGEVLGDKRLLTNWTAVIGTVVGGAVAVGLAGTMLLPQLSLFFKKAPQTNPSSSRSEVVTSTNLTQSSTAKTLPKPPAKPLEEQDDGTKLQKETQEETSPSSDVAKNEDNKVENAPVTSESTNNSSSSTEGRSSQTAASNRFPSEPAPPVVEAPPPAVASTRQERAVVDVPPPAPIESAPSVEAPPPTVAGIECRGLADVVEPKRRLLANLFSNLDQASRTTADRRSSALSYVRFLNQEINALNGTVQNLRGMTLTDARLDQIRDRYAGAVEEGVVTLGMIREVIQRSANLNDERWQQEIVEMTPLIKDVNNRILFVQSETRTMMQDAVDYCRGKV